MFRVKIEDGREASCEHLSVYLRTPSFPTSLQLNLLYLAEHDMTIKEHDKQL